MLREQLVYQRNALDAAAMQNLVYRVQLRNDGHCSRALWSPVIYPDAGIPSGCVKTDEGDFIGPIKLPLSGVGDKTGRLPGGHILVIFKHDTLSEETQPADGAICWFYHAEFEVWASGYAS